MGTPHTFFRCSSSIHGRSQSIIISARCCHTETGAQSLGLTETVDLSLIRDLLVFRLPSRLHTVDRCMIHEHGITCQGSAVSMVA
jgi:hypothetical protein